MRKGMRVQMELKFHPRVFFSGLMAISTVVRWWSACIIMSCVRLANNSRLWAAAAAALDHECGSVLNKISIKETRIELLSCCHALVWLEFICRIAGAGSLCGPNVLHREIIRKIRVSNLFSLKARFRCRRLVKLLQLALKLDYLCEFADLCSLRGIPVLVLSSRIQGTCRL